MTNLNSRYWTEPGRREYQRQYRREAKISARCAICGKPFQQDIYDKGKTCSRHCTGLLSGRRRRERNAGVLS